MDPPAEVMSSFTRRSDQQIMALELLSISLGIHTFRDEIAGQRLVIHSDNTGSEVCFPFHGDVNVLVRMCVCFRVPSRCR